MPWYSKCMSVKNFYQTSLKPREPLSQLHCSLLYWYLHSCYPNTLRHKSKTRPRLPDTFLSRNLIFKRQYLKNCLDFESLMLIFEISTIKLTIFINKNFRVIFTLRKCYFLWVAVYHTDEHFSQIQKSYGSK